ncbi:MAG: FAD-binding oxidoreductase, partial [Candidatus Neomarinimicrobiota bacterium]
FSSKGFKQADRKITGRTISKLFDFSQGGRIPILIDTTPCTYKFINGDNILEGKSLEKWKSLSFVDITRYLKTRVDNSQLPPLKSTVIIHPTCSSEKMGLNSDLSALAAKCSQNPIIPVEAGCCGFAGDRGLKFPELTASATKPEAAEIKKMDSNLRGYSSSRTCEIGMKSGTGNDFYSIAVLVRSYLNQDI